MIAWAITTDILAGGFVDQDVTHIRIVSFSADSDTETVSIELRYGWLVSSVFTPSPLTPWAWPGAPALDNVSGAYGTVMDDTEDNVHKRIFTELDTSNQIPAGSIVTV